MDSCKYPNNVGLQCLDWPRPCETCGWNPDVADRRMKKILEAEHLERCVCCGAIIPEGRQVCPNCERKGDNG